VKLNYVIFYLNGMKMIKAKGKMSRIIGQGK